MKQLQDKLDKLQDLVTSLERLWMYDEAEELQELLLNPRATDVYIINQFEDRFNNLLEKYEWDWTDCERDEEGNQWETDLKWLEKITDVEIDYKWYKDVVKYDRCYLFYDNVLSRWMVRWEQRLWLSNIEKDWCYNWQRSQEYIDKWTGVKENIKWMPRIQDFTLNEYQRMLDKHWIDIDRDEVVEATNNKVVTRWWVIHNIKLDICPNVEMIKAMIQDERDVFNYENEGQKQLFKEAIDKENEKEKNEVYEKIDKEAMELRKLKEKAEKEAMELRKLVIA